VDGTDIEAVYSSAGIAIEHIRNGTGPSFLRAFCPRMEGHYLGDPVRRANVIELSVPLTKAFVIQPGASIAERTSSLAKLLTMVGKAAAEKQAHNDPVAKARRKLAAQGADITAIEKDVKVEIKQAVESALM